MTTEPVIPAATFRRKGAAEYLDVSETTIKRLEAQGVLVPIRVSERVVRYTKSQLDRYLAALEQEVEHASR